jgi:hypothetical protein
VMPIVHMFYVVCKVMAIAHMFHEMYQFCLWPRICSICRKHFQVLSSFMTYQWVCN